MASVVAEWKSMSEKLNEEKKQRYAACAELEQIRTDGNAAMVTPFGACSSDYNDIIAA